MSQDPVYVTTPVGRHVMGDAFNGNDKDHQGRPRFTQSGQPKTTWFVGLAIPKNDPGWADFWGQIVATAQRDYPAGQWQAPGFAWKVVDGDGKNQNGQPYPEHCHGHYVVRLSSGFAPTVWNAQNQQITDPSQCKRGDYVRAYIAVRGNDDQQKPGVYLSHSMVQVVGYGEAITSGPSAAQAFGAPAALPPGASQTPVAPAQGMPAPAGALAPQAAPTQAPVPAPGVPGAPAAPQAAPTAYPGNVQPHPAILNGPTQ